MAAGSHGFTIVLNYDVYMNCGVSLSTLAYPRFLRGPLSPLGHELGADLRLRASLSMLGARLFAVYSLS